METLHDQRDAASESDTAGAASTGKLPPEARIDEVLERAYLRYKDDDEGVVADYIPALAAADPSLFGLSILEVDGTVHQIGHSSHEFSIQSISKAFVFALVDEALGHDSVRGLIGVNNTGMPFNSVLAVELGHGHPGNPMVNAGAMATTALVPGSSSAAQWDFIRSGLSAFAGRKLKIDAEVYDSEAATNQRNQSMAQLLQSYGHIHADPRGATDLYTKQCSLLVSANDLAVMGGTLANAGVNPQTGERVVSGQVARDTLAAMAAAGLYERSGDWLYEIGMPGKSGVSGGIVTISPGKGAVGSFSAPLDPAGNSVRGQRATHYLSGALGLNLFSSQPYTSKEITA